MVCLRSGKNTAKESIMAAQLIFGLALLLVTYAGTTFLLIEILMWAMRRLDDPRAYSRSRMSAVEYQFASTVSVQATLAQNYPLSAHMISDIEAEGYPPAGREEVSVTPFQTEKESGNPLFV
jgi:hypothetical protein